MLIQAVREGNVPVRVEGVGFIGDGSGDLESTAGETEEQQEWKHPEECADLSVVQSRGDGG